MSCHHPYIAYRSRNGVSDDGTWPLVNNVSDGYSDLPVVRPCGKCIGCRVQLRRDKAIRATHEATLYDYTSFITLTYSDDKLPYESDGIYPVLIKRDVQLFLKKFRRSIEPHKIRYFGCGELGARTRRPHYHLLIYNWMFPDRRIYDPGPPELYESAHLTDCWDKGLAVIGDVTPASAMYVAGYALKKLVENYEDESLEFGLSSRRPGIGYGWIDKWMHDVYPRDSIVWAGIEVRPPRYYDDFLKSKDPDLYRVVMSARRQKMDDFLRSPDYLKKVAPGVIRSVVLEAKLAQKSQKF